MKEDDASAAARAASAARSMSTPSPQPDGLRTDLDAFCTRYYPLVERRVQRLLSRDIRRNRPWLDSVLSTGDVVHDVFLGVVRDHGAFRGQAEASMVAYLARLVRNRLIDAVRFHEASVRDQRRNEPVDLDRPRSQRSPGGEVVHAEELRQFHRALASFGERERAILQARLEDAMPFAHLARTFGYRSADSARKAFHALQARLVVRMRSGGGT